MVWMYGLERIVRKRPSSHHHGAPCVLDVLEQQLHNVLTGLLYWMDEAI